MVNTGQDSNYSSNDIYAMANQVPVTEREGLYDTLGEFSMEGVEDESLEYLFEEVLGNGTEVSLSEELEANYGQESKLQDISTLEP